MFSTKPLKIVYFPGWSIWRNSSGHHGRHPIDDTLLGTADHPAVFMNDHHLSGIELIWRRQRPYSNAKPVRRTEIWLFPKEMTPQVCLFSTPRKKGDTTLLILI